MIVQKNEKTNQLFLNLPKQLCKSMQIDKGTNIRLMVKGEMEITMIINGEDVNGEVEKEVSEVDKGTQKDIKETKKV